ncbi:hypothetical protein BJX96DRAFT_182057 [Aspergillus floccosus]
MRLSVGWKPPGPELVPTDTVVPVPLMDDQQLGRNSCVHHTYIFNDVLDTDKLQRSLQRLLEIGGWRKLGARVRMNLDYHIPARYDAERPGFIFTTVAHPIKIGDHPLASYLPKSMGKPALFEPFERITSLCLHPDCPQKLEDWLYSDQPQLNVHVVVFHDATLLTMTFMHFFMDGMSIALVFRAWSAVLNGCEEQVPSFRGIDEDLLRPQTTIVPASDYMHYKKWLRGFKMFIFSLRSFWESIRFPHEERRHFCIPGDVIGTMRSQMLQELGTSLPNEHQPAFLSEGDVLLAWCLRATLKGLGVSPSRSIALFSVFDARSSLLRVSETNDAFVMNVILLSSTYMRARDIIHLPLSSIAWQIRHSLILQRTRSQCQAQLGAMRAALDKTGTTAFFAEPTSLLIGCSNWHKGRFYDIDFSAAVTLAGDPAAGRRNCLGRPLHIICNKRSGRFSMRNMGLIYGKDAAGDWWVSWTLRPDAWDTIQLELKKLEQLGKLEKQYTG